MTNVQCLVFILFHILIILQANGERTKDKMYEKIEGTSACFRRFNSTHQTGCTSSRPGSIGVIHIVNSIADLEFVFKNCTAGPYIAVMPVTMLTSDTLHRITNHPDIISGVIVHKNITTPVFFSNELKCPNENYGLKDSCDNQEPWNPHGTAILQGDYPFPIFLISNIENLKKLTNCFKKFNDFDYEYQSQRSLCSLELSSFMFGAVNSETCLRRSHFSTNFSPMKYCDPLGDRNVWSTLFPWQNSTDRISDVVLVTTRMDTTSLFNEITPGAVSPLTGLIGLLSTAEVLKRMVEETGRPYKKNVFFVIFNGESYDYIGSQRFVYDIIENQFPMEQDDNIKNQVPQLKLDDISLIVELGQLSQKSDLFAHHLKNNSEQNVIENFKKILVKNSKPFSINVKNSKTGKMPPASLQSFLEENENISGIVLTDHDQIFTNNFYNSMYDDNENIGYKYYNVSENEIDSIPIGTIQRHVATISTILARSLYEEIIGEKYNGKEEGRVYIVNELFNCYLNTANCKIHKATTLKEYIDEKPLSLYVSVITTSNSVTALTARTLSWLTGNITNITEKKCNGDPQNPVYQYLWMSTNLDDMNDTACYSTTMNYSLAVSPAFEINDYDWQSGRYSSWTESAWNNLNVRMFLKPAARHELMTISVGTVTLVLSVALVYFIKTRSDILFPKPVATGPGTSC